jgi:hypothetical protein
LPATAGFPAAFMTAGWNAWEVSSRKLHVPPKMALLIVFELLNHDILVETCLR